MNVLIAGGTGFVGRHLATELLARGHDVAIMSRRPDTRRPAPQRVTQQVSGQQVAGEVGLTLPEAGWTRGDVSDPASLTVPLEHIDVAYYLVHSLDRPDFVVHDRHAAHTFAKAASAAGVQRIVYMGALGDDADQLSPHLQSRREVEQILAEHVPTTTLRAGIVVGDGGTSWEILCQLVERLPIMVTPKWVQTITQPVALADVVSLLAKVIELRIDGSEHFDIGAPESLSYEKMLRVVAEEMRRSLFILPVPLLSPSLSSHWLRLITDVDLQTARSLVDSMTNEVIVTERRLEQLTGHRPMTYRTAARQALIDRRRRKASAVAGDAA